MRTVAAALLAIGVLGVVGAADGRTAVTEGLRDRAATLSGSILFYGGPDFGLYAIDAAGSSLRQLSEGADLGQWSPDGRRLAFRRLCDDPPCTTPEGLYVMGPDTRVPRLLVRTTGFISYTWAPDGRWIAFGESGAIWVVPTRGGRRVQLTRRGGDSGPLWSPDGRTIVFHRAGKLRSSYELYAMSPDGSHRRHLADGATPSWSPDGRRLAYAANGHAGVFVIDADGTGRHRILGKGNIVAFAWSPDGRWIALSGAVGNQGGTFVVHPDGSGFRRISTLGEFLSPPSWSPDSRSLAVEDSCCSPDIWAVALDGGSQRRLTEGWRYGYGNYHPEWNPRGLSAARLPGTDVPASLPTDSVFDSRILRTTHPITGLAADGSAVAVAYGRYPICAEVWEPAARSLTTFPGCPTPTGFGFAGDRVVWSHYERGGGVISWRVETGTTDVPNFRHVQSRINTPMSDFVGDGQLLTFDSWSGCTRDGQAVCAPKNDSTLYRLDGAKAIPIASSPGALTALAVDDGRILVDHENGALELMNSDGSSRQTFHVYLGDFLGAKLQGDDVVVLKHDTIADYDADSGALRHEWPFATDADRVLEDVQDGVAVCVSGTRVDLLKLSDGHETVIDAPGTGRVLAQLEPSGLFYSYTAEDATYPGRVAFVPFDQLPLQ